MSQKFLKNNVKSLSLWLNLTENNNTVTENTAVTRTVTGILDTECLIIKRYGTVTNNVPYFFYRHLP